MNDSAPMKIAAVRTVGIAGWGRMGAEMGKCLVESGWKVLAYDPAPEARHAIAAAGATLASGVGDLATRSDLVLIVVVDDEQVKDVITGDDGALTHASPGTILAICASVRPDTCIAVAEKANARGVHVIDVALVGGERGAEQAALRLMCGGPETVIDMCRGAFAAFATDVCHIGAVGTGQVAKTANNILLWSCIRADFEVLTLAKTLGVPPGKLRTFMAVGSGANRPLAEWGAHRLRWPKKDLEIALAMAQESGVEMPLIEALAPLMDQLDAQQLHALR